MKRVPFLLALAACAPEETDQGIAVGNPGATRVTTAPGTGVSLTYAQATVTSVTVTDCDRKSFVLLENATIDLLGATTIGLPPGTWCEWSLSSAAVSAQGIGDDGSTTLDLYLEVPTVTVADWDGFEVDGTSAVLELAEDGWLDAEELGFGGVPVFIDPSTEQHEMLVSRITTASTLVEDQDGDGIASEGDLVMASAEQALEGPPAADSGEDDPKGCSEGTLSGMFCGPLAWLGLRRRRR